MRIRITLVTALIILVGVTAKAGGPWLAKKGSGFAQVQFIVPAYQYSGLLMSNLRDVQRINRYTHNSDYMAYLEYGVTDKIDVITTLPFKYVRTNGTTDQLYNPVLLDQGALAGLSNYHLGLKYALLDKGVKVAVSAHARFNTASFDVDKGLATGYDANSFGLMLHAGAGTAKRYGFAEVGYHYMTNGYSGIFEMNLEHGWIIKDKWYLAATFNIRKSLMNGGYDNGNLVQTGLYVNNQEWVVGSAKLARDFKNGWGLSTALPLVPIYFKYVGFNGTFSFGLYKKF